MRVVMRFLCLLRALLMSFSFFFSSRRRHTRLVSDWSSDVCSSDLHPQLADELVVSHEDHLPARRRRDDPLAHQGAPEALHEVEIRRHLVGPVDRERELLRVVIERAERDAEAPRLGRRRLGGRYADDMEAAPYTVGEAGEEHGGGMPRAEPDAHPVRDQLEHPCRGVLQTWIRHPRLAARVGTPFQRRKPPTDALTLSPSRPPGGGVRSLRAFPPPTTTSSALSAARRRSTTSSTHLRQRALPRRLKPRMPTYSSNVRPCLYGRCASSIGSRAPSMMSADPRPVPRPRKSMRPPR